MTKIDNSYICVFHNTRDVDKLCRECDGKMTTCDNYIPQLHRLIQKNQELIDTNEKVLKQYVPMVVRIRRLPRNYQEWIRNANDSGTI